VEDVRRIIEQGRGSHFDPGMTDVFLAHFDRFVAIAARYSGLTATKLRGHRPGLHCPRAGRHGRAVPCLSSRAK
jgi:response regulator RpfG family c-di-GMP phosphodiesterase